MNLNNSIRFVIIVDKSDTMIFGGQKERIKNHNCFSS